MTWRGKTYVLLLRLWASVSRLLPRQGIGRLAQVLSPLVPAGELTAIPVGRGSMLVPLSDHYYARQVARAKAYEPEVARVIQKSLPHLSSFVDCGANLGYWSIFVGTQSQGCKVLAIEADPRNIFLLERSRTLNRNAFLPIHAAVSDTDGDPVAMDTSRTDHHAIGRVVPAEGTPGCLTITLDTVMATHEIEPASCLIKMDIEGLESLAFRGARRTLGNGAVIVYEDHGLDDECLATRTALSLGLTVFLLEPGGQELISDVAQLRSRKKSVVMGYNLVAGRQDSSLLMSIQSGC